MRSAVAISLALAATLAGADAALAGGTHCSLVVRGVNIWHGKCRVTEDEFGFHAEAWSAYQHDQRHPGAGNTAKDRGSTYPLRAAPVAIMITRLIGVSKMPVMVVNS
jgi:hypothetical protein